MSGGQQACPIAISLQQLKEFLGGKKRPVRVSLLIPVPIVISKSANQSAVSFRAQL
jgi:hypothetical protein